MKAFIDEHREIFGVEPICEVLQVAPSAYWRHAARRRNPALRSALEQRDDALIPHIERVWHANLRVYGAEQVWQQLRDRSLANRCYDNYEQIIDACCDAWNKFTQIPGAIRSLCSRSWACLTPTLRKT